MKNNSLTKKKFLLASVFFFAALYAGLHESPRSISSEINICEFDPGNCMPKRPAPKISKFFLVNPTSSQQHVTFLDCHGNFKSISIPANSYQYISTELQSDNPGCLAPTVSYQQDRVNLDRLGNGGGLIVGETDRLVWTHGNPDQTLQWAKQRIADQQAAKDREAAEEKSKAEERQRAINELEQRRLKAKQEAKEEQRRRKAEYEQQRTKTVNDTTNAIEALIDKLFK